VPAVLGVMLRLCAGGLCGVEVVCWVLVGLLSAERCWRVPVRGVEAVC
jgi:hypothetical protein